MFELIILGGVGGNVNGALVTLQFVVSSYFVIKFLFSSIKDRPLAIKVMTLGIPLTLITTYLMAVTIGFGAFLSGGFDTHSYTYLANLTLTPSGVYQIMACVFLFVVLALIYSRLYRFGVLQWVLSFGVETLAAVVLLVLYGSLFLENPPFTILDLCVLDVALVRWPIYGLFALVFKNFVLLTALVVGALLKPRKSTSSPARIDEERYLDGAEVYQRQAGTWLTQNYMAAAIAMLSFGAAAEGFLLWLCQSQPPSLQNLEEFFGVVFAFLLFATPLGMGGVFLYCALRPKVTKGYRQLAAMGDENTVFRLFYEEVISGAPVVSPIGFNQSLTVSEHFSISQSALRKTVSLRAPLTSAVAADLPDQ